jgi:biopolymer transport protein ExbB
MGLFAGHKRRWWSTLAVICLVLLFAFVVVGPGGVQTARAAEGEGGGDQSGEEPNLFWHMLNSVPLFFALLLLAVSICLVTLIVLLAMDLRMSVSVPPEFVEDFTETVNKRQFKQAFDMARADTSFLARVLTAGMGRLQYGLEDAREAALNMTESTKAGKDNLITYLATIGTLGPMLGLVGTVYGMIKTFMVMASHTTSAPKASELAEGISEALVITFFGIAISIPAIFCHAFFRNRLIRIAMDSSNMADDLLTQMYHHSKRPAGSDTASRTATATPAVATPVVATPAVATPAVVEARVASPGFKTAEQASRPGSPGGTPPVKPA